MIRDFISINVGTESKTTLGHDCYIMSFSYIAHDVEIENSVTVASHVSILGSAIIQDEVFLGASSVVHQGALLKTLCMLGANSFGKGVLEEGLIYTGSPAVILKINEIGLQRSSKKKNQIDLIRKTAEKLINN